MVGSGFLGFLGLTFSLLLTPLVHPLPSVLSLDFPEDIILSAPLLAVAALEKTDLDRLKILLQLLNEILHPSSCPTTVNQTVTAWDRRGIDSAAALWTLSDVDVGDGIGG